MPRRNGNRQEKVEMARAHAAKRYTKHNKAVTLVESSGQAWERQTEELVEKRSASRHEANWAVLERNRKDGTG